LVHVAFRYGERAEVAYVLPLSVDGFLTVAAIVMSEDRRNRRPVRSIAKIAFVTGLGASIAANVSAAHPSTGGRLIAAWPAVALFLIVDMLIHLHPTTTENGQVPAGRRTRGTTRRPSVVTRQLAADILAGEPDLSREDLAARLGISTRRLRTVLTTAAPGGGIHDSQLGRT
jgi:Protein of unknown function (DUF2637)